MTRKARVWARRVARWRASGKTSEQFCEGQGFTAGLLRHWACRLGDRVRKRRRKAEIRLARVVRGGTEGERIAESGTAAPALTIEVGRARVSVQPRFSRAMLAEVIEVLAAVAGGER